MIIPYFLFVLSLFHRDFRVVVILYNLETCVVVYFFSPFNRIFFFFQTQLQFLSYKTHRTQKFLNQRNKLVTPFVPLIRSSENKYEEKRATADRKEVEGGKLHPTTTRVL